MGDCDGVLLFITFVVDTIDDPELPMISEKFWETAVVSTRGGGV